MPVKGIVGAWPPLYPLPLPGHEVSGFTSAMMCYSKHRAPGLLKSFHTARINVVVISVSVTCHSDERLAH